MPQPASFAGPDPEKPLRVGAVLLAAGQGSRFGGGVPKQFLRLGGQPVFMHSVDLFRELQGIIEIALVLAADGMTPEFESLLKDFAVPIRRTSGGARRQDSVAAGLAALVSQIDVALVHDTARPFPPAAAIELLVRRTLHCGGGLLAARATDTIKRAADEPGGPVVAETIDRESIWLAQTPQAIRADLIPRAIEELRRRDLNVTDEASLLESWGIPVALIESPASNFKITTADDLARAEAMLARRLP